MTWTTPAAVRAQVRKLWDRGALPAQVAGGEELFPRRLKFKTPNSQDLAQRFDEVRDWIIHLERGAKYYRLVWRNVNHRILGANTVPAELWIDTLEDALSLIGCQREARRLAALGEETRERLPQLLPWLLKRPLRALHLADEWPRLLDIVDWLRHHGRPAIYVRQVDIPGVHSKFIEGHRAVLAELFELALPVEAIDPSAVGSSGFYRRYGFRQRPLLVRFRILDAELALLATATDQDFTLTHDTFARLDLPVERIFITENETNFLAFPAMGRSMVIFGAGYGFEMLARAEWLHRHRIYYWGDLDTHGFAILDQLRSYFPAAVSFLMDRATLLAHRPQWGTEPQPQTRDLQRLTAREAQLYQDLCENRIARQLRLEQERIGFEWVLEHRDLLLGVQDNGISS